MGKPINKYQEMLDKVLERKLRVMEKYVEEKLQPLFDIGKPEEVIGKPYSQWTPEDRQKFDVLFKDNEYAQHWVFKMDKKKTLQEEEEVGILEGL